MILTQRLERLSMHHKERKLLGVSNMLLYLYRMSQNTLISYYKSKYFICQSFLHQWHLMFTMLDMHAIYDYGRSRPVSKK